MTAEAVADPASAVTVEVAVEVTSKKLVVPGISATTPPARALQQRPS
jgi:hypothetical protein